MSGQIEASSSEKDGKILFTLEEPEFNQNSYIGRFKAFQKTCNPANAFLTNKQID